MDVGSCERHIHCMDTVIPALVPEDFPELAMLVWNRNPARPIKPEEAYALYERNWRFVDRNRLIPRERTLIKTLTERFGRGHFLG